MTYSEAIQFLYNLRLFGAKFGLENTLKLAALAGNPQNQLRFIHVAGTNGKGSTCAMLESIYRAAGLRVGLFTSPHLVSFRERIQVNRQLISESDVVRMVDELRGLVAAGVPPAVEPGVPPGGANIRISQGMAVFTPAPGGRMPPSTSGGTPDATNRQDACPTFFEFITVMALKFFAERKCDLVIWETGLGGRLDATNIVMPLASVITNIAFDHEQWLGDTLAKIAAEKAGIIKPGIPVVTATDEPEALAVIEKTAREKKAPLINVGQASRLSPFEKIGKSETGATPVLPLLGEHQKINASLALAAVEALQNKIPASEGNIRAGLQNVNWPGRLQWVTLPDNQRLLLDGAHNVAGAKVLREALLSWSSIPRPAGLSGGTLKRELQQAGSKTGAPRKFTLILGILQDKDWQHICEILAPLASRIFTVPVSSERSANPNQLAATCRAANPAAEVTTCASLGEALNHLSVAGIGRADLPVGLDAQQRVPTLDPPVVITGSLYLVGEALELLELSPAADGERALNEWRAEPVR